MKARENHQTFEVSRWKSSTKNEDAHRWTKAWKLFLVKAPNALARYCS